MTTKKCSRNPNACEQHGGNRPNFIAILSWLIVAPLLTNCGSSNSPFPLPPTPNNVYLSAKYASPYGSACSSIGVCPGMTDFGESDKYYQTLGADPTLAKWQQHYGFTSGSPIYHASYGNQADLQLGRDMFCTTSGLTVACYVSNYGQAPFINNQENLQWPNLASAVSDAVAINHNGNGHFATVAMVYTPAPNMPQGAPPGANSVSFYVYDGADNLLHNAALDGDGAKSVPRMCMACHGGAYVGSTDPSNTSGQPYVTGASFLPFDTGSFKYDPSLTEDQQQEAFRNLNATVMQTSPPAGIVDFINGLYCSSSDNKTANNPTTGPCRNKVTQANATTFDGYIPPNWCPPSDPTCQNPNAQSTLYLNVVKPYCRMCHLAGEPAFTQYSEFVRSAANIETLVCSDGVMPHAEVPFGSLTNLTFEDTGIGFWWEPSGTPGKDLQNFLNSQGITQTDNCKYK